MGITLAQYQYTTQPTNYNSPSHTSNAQRTGSPSSTSADIPSGRFLGLLGGGSSGGLLGGGGGLFGGLLGNILGGGNRFYARPGSYPGGYGAYPGGYGGFGAYPGYGGYGGYPAFGGIGGYYG